MRRPAAFVPGLLAVFLALPAAADLRVASYNAELSRKGPGLLLRDILSRKDDQVAAVVEVIAAARPDILALQGIDYDLDGLALTALADLLRARDLDYPHRFALSPNTGLRSGLDLDGDGRTGGPGDAQGFGYFAGQDGMAILSRFPILTEEVRDFSALLWRDLPGATLPETDGAPFPSPEAQAVQRLSTTGHWDVPVDLGGTVLHLLTFHATPPVFDGPEDRNGLRNRDELRLWTLYLDGALDLPPPDGPFVVLGDANLDPEDGHGRSAAMRAFLADPRLTDPLPESAGAAAAPQTGANAAQRGVPARDTAEWDDNSPGNLRVDYVLPSAAIPVTGAGVFWPAAGPLAETVRTASRHRLVWADLALP
ncbi:endonuclease/exonuclease/phosphatase family protein [Rhodovulum kholense]|uniref:Endonuclease/exonuclease/phosphatase family metal-dependent hydrolase n=1 Tax=Rhodovulum kholense TaxID=453584 RepID=A0A8E3AQB0_9RHOB|nr:endonuclease/exonuclease/phosphatase family protein [Rhodovulum kholense]PTW44491.1 endonuclease/exonuclease/phosphatase family metal-dependent hydrolase [Rhodovulum kholense]